MMRPMRLVIEMVMPVSSSAKNAPVIEKGTESMTTREKRIDSNCMAMTTKTRKTAIARAL